MMVVVSYELYHCLIQGGGRPSSFFVPLTPTTMNTGGRVANYRIVLVRCNDREPSSAAAASTRTYLCSGNQSKAAESPRQREVMYLHAGTSFPNETSGRELSPIAPRATTPPCPIRVKARWRARLHHLWPRAHHRRETAYRRRLGSALKALFAQREPPLRSHRRASG
ncbi:uncharacterized protein LY79DRAFT_559112 [Colletotrichum navitas]|uniref:Uncharacterized protein n=1 Tax=Colletotrichum navitas TaxID=681940 RepID=A0AAD8PV50_9PEZI|nr:uncharacterized protein LY79DRAFT_559112 [Colletotrichum navitas]KAK1585230.1 hypothetical protein LY79DRAFT_559112 [Colletotrichum navitas]